MSHEIPTEWQFTSPTCFVTGDGPYALALGFVLGTAIIPLDHLAAGPTPNKNGGFPRVLENLRWVFLIVPDEMPASGGLQLHQQVWQWVEKLTFAREQHDLSFLFVLSPSASQEYEANLAAGLVVPEIDPATTGHAVWRRSSSLRDLLDLAARTVPLDAVSVRARRVFDSRHVALAQLMKALTQNDPDAGRKAAKVVQLAFQGQEYYLDLFCRPPSHQNGNRLREWLNRAVTDTVTREEWPAFTLEVADWLSTGAADTR